MLHTKKILNITLTLLVLVLISSPLKPDNKTGGFILKGKLNGVPDGKVKLQKAAKYLGFTFTDIDETQLKNGQFKFKGKVELPEMYYIQVEGIKGNFKIFVENSNISVSCKQPDWKTAVVSGSKIHDQLKEFYSKLTKLDKVELKKKNLLVKYIKSHGDSMLASYLTLKHLSNKMDFTSLSPLVESFSPKIAASVYGKQLAIRLKILSNLMVGKKAPDFKAPTPGGQAITLSSLRGKYVLIDFWASWCTPCRKENPGMVKFYNQMDKKKFEIIGIALDFSRKRWIKAIKDDQLPWINISQVKGFDGIASEYGIRSIPSTLFLSPDGIILFKNIRGEALMKRILEILNQ